MMRWHGQHVAGLLIGVGILIGSMLGPASGMVAEDCQPTPRQTEGPYYPPASQMAAQADHDHDLTRLAGKKDAASGQVLFVRGIIRDEQCRPVEGATVEIWQASANGRYQHPRDRDNPAPLDPNFQYWGTLVTDRDGRYAFTTIKPGAYAAGPRWIRPPHIHFKVTHPAFRPFITQLYFAGDAHQDRDFILNEIPKDRRHRVIVPLEDPPDERDPSGRDAKLARFDVVLSR